MVVKMMKWRPWPPLITKKYQVRVVVRRLEGVGFGDSVRANSGKDHGVAVEIRWKGSKIGLRSLRRNVKRDYTKEESVGRNGVVRWGEEFQCACNISTCKGNVFHPWEISFTVFNGLNERPKNKGVVIGSATLNLAEFALQAIEKEIELKTPLVVSGNGAEHRPTLRISLHLLELRSTQEQAAEPLQKSIMPIQPSVENHLVEKNEVSALKAGLRKVKILTGLSTKSRAHKPSHKEDQSEEEEGRSGEESHDEYDEEESDDTKDDDHDEDDDGSYNYYSHARHKSENEDWVFHHHHNNINNNRQLSDKSCFVNIDESSTGSVSEPSVSQSSGRSNSVLPWKKRKMSFRSPKAKAEPLLKKAYGEECGEYIDFDRRQLCSNDSISHRRQNKDDMLVLEFGDESFAVGRWEEKEVKSRDGLMKLETQVFFASIDQRSEKAAGESACTALVAVIAHWFHNNKNLMPTKSQFDTLIHEGSLQWRNLCKNPTYKEQFPDKHFDLETVLQTNIRPISAVQEKSFIGFFHPEGLEGNFDFLYGAMSFDSMWEEISRAAAHCCNGVPPHLYIVSWNDHFFVLRVDSEAYYIIDTLGERLYEGCNKAYILKFDRKTIIRKLHNDDCSSTKEEVLCTEKETCKEYIKSFLAAIPIRELEKDVKKGLMLSMPLHCRLQIEFHYTKLQPYLTVVL